MINTFHNSKFFLFLIPRIQRFRIHLSIDEEEQKTGKRVVIFRIHEISCMHHSGPTGAMNISQTVTTHHGAGAMQTYQGTGMTHMQHMQMGQPQGVMPSGQQQMAQMQQLQPHQYQAHGKG